jgi:hypothetical protein
LKLYKFRPLANDLDLCRAINILKTGEFRCSSFWELNDPMEGIFYTLEDKDDIINKIYCEKSNYKICSFSGGGSPLSDKGFNNPTLWGYYANGFKGIAVEVEIDEDNTKETEEEKNYICPVSYEKGIPKWERNSTNEENIRKILTTKLDYWGHEAEYRFLNKNLKKNFFKIGKITSVYFGCPYKKPLNNKEVFKNKIIYEYLERKNNLSIIAKEMDIKRECVSIAANKIKKNSFCNLKLN